MYAEADFLYAFAEIFWAKLVREMAIKEFERLKDIYFQPCIFFILGNYVTTQVKVVRSCHKNPVATDKTKT